MSKGEGKEIRSESTGVGGVFRAPLWNLDLLLSELEDFEQKRHDHEHRGSKGSLLFLCTNGDELEATPEIQG